MQPWIESPYNLLTWFDMEKFAAEEFCRIAGNLAMLSHQFGSYTGPQVAASDLKSLSRQFSGVAKTCRTIGLNISALQLDDAADRLIQWGSWAPLQVSQLLICLNVAINSEMSTQLFMRIFPDRVIFYEQPELFGAVVNSNFPSALRDIKSAGSCYAADRNTACVMHLMRALEVGLSTMATALSVPFDRRNWENIINDIEAEIKKISGPNWGPDWKQKLQFYSGAAKDFRYFKDAWRNHAMHFREHYEASEAKTVLDHVRTFMVHLAEGGLVEKTPSERV